MLEFFYIEWGNHRWVALYPNECSVCHHNVVIGATSCVSVLNEQAQAVFLCPNQQCRSLFIGYYSLREGGHAELVTKKPTTRAQETFPEVIREISPAFASIYAEAHQAKDLGLMQIAGPGYRKAFEFLIKDYAKHCVPDSQDTTGKDEEIEQSFSGKVVKNYIDDARIQAVAKRALWVGNDETHYLREWKQHDIGDLITLIKLTIHWIEIQHLSERYVKDMPE